MTRKRQVSGRKYEREKTGGEKSGKTRIKRKRQKQRQREQDKAKEDRNPIMRESKKVQRRE